MTVVLGLESYGRVMVLDKMERLAKGNADGLEE